MARQLATPVERVAETTYDEFENRMRDIPIAIIYPRHRARSALVAMFLQLYSHDVVYYRLSKADDTLNNWLRHMAADDHFPAGFGSQALEAIDRRVDPEDVAAAFGADLTALRRSPFLLLLDQFDCLEQSSTTERFFRALPAHLPRYAQIVINARLLGLQPWNDLVLAKQAVVVGDDEAIGGSIYGNDPGLGQLEVHSLSGGYVYADGQPVMSWDGSLPRHLFYYFVDNPMVTRDQIFSIFWPNMSIKEATNVFHVTKRKISERLGHELTNYSSGFYVHSPRLQIHYDARLFEHAVHQAVEDEDNAPSYWYEAAQYYRSDYLPYITMPWVQNRREELKNLYARALIGLGRYYRGLNEPSTALGYLLRALREKPDWEDVHRDVMMIFYQQGDRDAAVAQYRQLEKTLQAMFSIAPSKDTRRLFEVITAV